MVKVRVSVLDRMEYEYTEGGDLSIQIANLSISIITAPSDR